MLSEFRSRSVTSGDLLENSPSRSRPIPASTPPATWLPICSPSESPSSPQTVSRQHLHFAPLLLLLEKEVGDFLSH